MAVCSQCGATILFGGVRDAGRRFCNRDCAGEAGPPKTPGEPVDPELLFQEVEAVRHSACPSCRREADVFRGPVDLHGVHIVWSLLVVTSWKSQFVLACRSCARRKQATSLFTCLVAGWWGFPFGFIMTPIQAGRNIAGLLGGPKRGQASAQLFAVVESDLEWKRTWRKKPAAATSGSKTL